MRKRRRSLYSPVLLEKKTIKTIIGIGLLAFAILLFLSLFYQTGVLLSLRENFYSLFGIGIIFVPFFIVVIGLLLLSLRLSFLKINLILGLFSALLCLLGLIALYSQEFAGSIGTSLWSVVESFVTPVGAFFVLISLFLISVVIALNTSLEQAIATIVAAYKKILSFFKTIKIKIFGSGKPSFFIKSPEDKRSKINILQKEPSQMASDAFGRNLSSNLVVNPPGQSKIWEYPPLSLLSDVQGTPANRGNIKQNAQILEKTLESFGITAKVVEIHNGPTITQYALAIPGGTKLSKILSLQNDLALALATTTGNVRIEAPIPGKSLVGIEIPNLSPEYVSLKSILSSDRIQKNKSKTVVGLGKDVTGNPVVDDLARMPHILIAGTTGSGKSVLLNALIATLLFRASPDEVKLILIDPKRVELSEYKDIPHLLTPVIIEPEKILSALKWAMQEMDERYKLFHEARVRNITGYNELSGFQALPYIVIIIDELHNLMDFAPIEVENAIVRLASMARATGIHLIVATQRPSVDVITGTIKANIPCRIAFNVSSNVDSRVIIDQPGAEKLIGKGDMLYVPPDASKPNRIQGVFVSDTEMRNLINFLKRSGIVPQYTEEVIQMPLGKLDGSQEGERDDFFEEAARTVCQFDKASASLLQRRLRIGYARAARILDQLEIEGVIGPGEGSKPRDVLIKNVDEFFQDHSS